MHFVYWNLHKRVWSCKALNGRNKGRVTDRAELVAIWDVKPRVYEKGRQRVLREKCKNVHAGIVGTLGLTGPRVETFDSAIEPHWRRLSYNPYKGPTFVYADTGEEFTGAKLVAMHCGEVWEIMAND